MIQYTVSPINLKAHLFEVELSLDVTGLDRLCLRLPAWIAGSYMIRDFARNIVSIQAVCDGVSVELDQADKHSWEVRCKGEMLKVCYQVYAFDLSVRGAYLDFERGFFNGACLFLEPVGFADTLCELTILSPDKDLFKDWQVATSLPVKPIETPFSLGTYVAKNYAELLDCPVEMGLFKRFDFMVVGIAHALVISGKYTADIVRLIEDIKKICAQQIQLFKGNTPFDSYLFLLHVADEGAYGGLEHRSSSALLASRMSLPASNMKNLDKDYMQLLGLISHEYFHAWNVKAIKPQLFENYNLSTEIYTEQLWIFEGITSYYDNLILFRAGIINQIEYLDLLAKNITQVYQGNGRTKQSLAASSFNAWTKLYKQDENSPNAIVSYYQKGALLALCLDLLIRNKSVQQLSLDDVMWILYEDFCQSGKGLPEGAWQRRVQEITALDLNEFFEQGVYGTEDLPLVSLLQSQGVTMELVALPDSSKGGDLFDAGLTPSQSVRLGIRYFFAGSIMRLTHVLDKGVAQCAGLYVGDEVIAIDGFKINQVERQLSRFNAGDSVELTFFRQGSLMSTLVFLQEFHAKTCFLTIQNPALNSWLKI